MLLLFNLVSASILLDLENEVQIFYFVKIMVFDIICVGNELANGEGESLKYLFEGSESDVLKFLQLQLFLFWDCMFTLLHVSDLLVQSLFLSYFLFFSLSADQPGA